MNKQKPYENTTPCPKCRGIGMMNYVGIDNGNRAVKRKKCPFCKGARFVRAVFYPNEK